MQNWILVPDSEIVSCRSRICSVHHDNQREVAENVASTFCCFEATFLLRTVKILQGKCLNARSTSLVKVWWLQFTFFQFFVQFLISSCFASFSFNTGFPKFCFYFDASPELFQNCLYRWKLKRKWTVVNFQMLYTLELSLHEAFIFHNFSSFRDHTLQSTIRRSIAGWGQNVSKLLKNT